MRQRPVLTLLLAAGLLLIPAVAQAHHRPGHSGGPTTSTSTTVAPTTTSTSTTTSTTLPAATTTTAPPQPALPQLGHYRDRAGLTWTQDQDQAAAVYGEFRGHRRKYHPQGTTWPASDVVAALDAGRRVFLNAKPGGTWASTAAGQSDPSIIVSLQTLAAHCDDNSECWVTWWHEPVSELNAGTFGTEADYRDMWRHLDFLRDQHAPEVKTVWVMEGWEPNQPRYLLCWPEDATHQGIVDYIGHDPYLLSSTDPAANLAGYIISRSQWFRANLHGASTRPVVIAEYGTVVGGQPRDTASRRAAAVDEITRRLPEIAAAGVVELDYWDDGVFGDGWLDDPPAADGAAYQQLKAATEAG